MIPVHGKVRITLLILSAGAIGGVVGYLLSIVYTTGVIPFIQKILPTISQESLLAVNVSLVFLLLVAVAIIYVYWKKSRTYIDLFDYSRDPNVGVSRHKATGEYFCTSCLINQIISPVRQDESGWYCLRKGCEQIYPHPKYKSPKAAMKFRRQAASTFSLH
jgi:hypothetical protein